MRHVYLSPHLDDAMLSCGGRIHLHSASGARALVKTVFAGESGEDELSPFAHLQHIYWGDPPQPMAFSRAEDRAALKLLDAEAWAFAASRAPQVFLVERIWWPTEG